MSESDSDEDLFDIREKVCEAPLSSTLQQMTSETAVPAQLRKKQKSIASCERSSLESNVCSLDDTLPAADTEICNDINDTQVNAVAPPLTRQGALRIDSK